MVKYNIFDKDIFIDEASGCFSSNYEELTTKVSYSYNIDEYEPNFDYYSTPILSFCVNLSNACNLACDYCFNGNKDNTSIELEHVFKFLDDGFNKFPDKEKYIVDLSGSGEPLLYLKKILKIKEYCVNISNKINREVLVQFVSNGTLLTSTVAEVLQENGILFGVSLDGNRITHNLHRRTKQNEDTYDLILNNIKSIKHKDYIGVAVTLTKDTFSLKDSLIELSRVFNTISYKPVRECSVSFDEESVQKWAQEYDELVLFLIEETLKGNFKYIYTILNGDDYLGKFIKRLFLDQKVVIRCDGGLSRFTLNHDLKIYTCPAGCGKEEFEVGENCQIDLNKSRDIFYSNFFITKCKSCPLRHICGQECLIEIKNNEPNNYMCQYKKHIILLAIYFYEIIKEKNIDIHESLYKFCLMVEKRKRKDSDLELFLRANNYNFTDGKRLYDVLYPKNN